MGIVCRLLAVWLALAAAARADDQPIERFDGHNSLTTADFTVPAGWEIRWHSDQVLSLGVIRLDNTVVAGTTGRNLGSLFLPQGGTFRIRVKSEDDIPWDVAIYALDKAAPDDGTASDYYTPTAGPAYTPPVPVPETNAAPDTPENVPAAPAPPPLPTQLSAEQLRCIVAIKGDRATGAGFLVKIDGDKFIVTTQELIAHNPNWRVFTSAGNAVAVTRIEGATDRDVALLTVKDFGYDALQLADAADVHAGDPVLTGGGAGPLVPTCSVTSLGPRRLDIDQLPMAPGWPIVLARSGRVAGVVAVAPQVGEADHFSDENFDQRDAAASESRAAFGLRLDNIPGREHYDLARLQAQEQFLDDFHQHSRTLDAYLNGTGSGDDTRLWQSDDKLKTANATFRQNSAGGDTGERTDALHALLFELGLAAETDLDRAQLPSNFYRYPGLRAKDETAYRQALKSELDVFNDNISSFNSIVTRDNNL